MTRSTNMEHVEVLERLRDRWVMPGERPALDAAIAALSAPNPEGDVVVTRNEGGEIVAVTRQDAEGRILSVIAEAAPQPPAEAQPVGELIEDGAETEEGDHFIHQFVGPRKLPEGTKVYTAPPPSAPVGVEGLDARAAVADLSEAARLAADAIGVLLPLLSSEQREVVCDAIAGADEARADILRALAQQPAAVDEAMVERACKAAVAQCSPNEVWPDDYSEADDLRAMMQAALTAALAAQQGGAK